MSDIKDFGAIYCLKHDLKLKDKLDGQGPSASLAFVTIAGELIYDKDKDKTSLYHLAKDTMKLIVNG